MEKYSTVAETIFPHHFGINEKFLLHAFKYFSNVIVATFFASVIRKGGKIGFAFVVLKFDNR